MNYILEFNQFDDLSEIEELAKDLISSEIDESIDLKVSKSLIDNNFNFKTKKSDDFDFDCYLISIKNIVIDEQSQEFKNILSRLEKVLNMEFNTNYKCIVQKGKNNPLSNTLICILDSNDYLIIKSINDFENFIEDSFYVKKIGISSNNEYSPIINILIDEDISWEKGYYKKIIIWLREMDNRVGIKLSILKENINNNFINYSISSNLIYNESNTSIYTYEKDLDLKNLPVKINFLSKKPDGISALKKLKEINDDINNSNFVFKMDIYQDTENESIRFVDFIKNKILVLFSNEITLNLSLLYKEFRKLEEYNIEANWTNQGNYLYIFDINYKGNFYLLSVKFDLKSDNVKIEFKDLGIKDNIKIKDFSETIYLYLEEN